MPNEQEHLAIVQTVNRYAIAVDARRWDLLDNVFTPDAVVVYRNLHWTSQAVFKREFAAAHETYDATQHAIANHLVEVADGTATAFSYCTWRLLRLGTDGGDFFDGTAWYDESLIRTDDGWRISRLDCWILWTHGNAAVTDAAGLAAWNDLRSEAAAGKVAYLRPFGLAFGPRDDLELN